ncbi:hypothetical protein [Enterococcus italicus]|uniref:hypothetical protein n=1 Tax=Enterococcus italicus TaxID=246144 RepID=UPI002073B6FA|nr:hypothetical protein [Enterococcus italicus]
MKKSTLVSGLSVMALSLLLAACGSSSSASSSSDDSSVTKVTVATGNDALPYAYLKVIKHKWLLMNMK